MLAAAAERDGVEVEEVRRALALPSGFLERRGVRVPIATVRRVWCGFTDRAAGPLLALRAARELPMGSLDLLDYLAQTSTTGEEAFEHLTRYLPLLADAGRVWIESDRQRLRVLHASPGGLPSLAELLFGLIVARSRELFGPTCAPRLVQFAHRPSAAVSVYEEVLGAPVRFGGGFDELVFDRDIVRAPIASSDPALRGILVAQAEAALARLGVRGAVERVEPEDDFVAVFRHALSQALDAGDPSLARIGESFGMSARTLQRRLSAARVSHRDLLQELRLERARRALGGAQAKEVSEELGYSSPSAFHRAFKRWTGVTPGALAAAPGAAEPLVVGWGGVQAGDGEPAGAAAAAAGRRP
ncbi:uncharacterized protein SOCE26_069310 [Sorangium cellulosum]|uniref:HTH araC/xylS-type domain-containing protein n=1 Tax=Sorangium cellulosum TaxID=56 RepID=A0A2L0F1L9_SORCE|nr:uncharacterized protein SOCE26_069310 [Sorangium cellulosum]